MTQGSGVRILAVVAYRSLYGAERANIRVLELLQQCGAAIECVARTDQASKPFRDELDRNGLVVHRALFGPDIFGLHWDLMRYARNLAGVIRVSWAILGISRRMRPTHLYFPNYIHFLYAFPAVVALRKKVVFRVGDPPESTRPHRIMWGKVIAPYVSAFVTNSGYTSRLLADVCGAPTKVHTIRNLAPEIPAHEEQERSRVADQGETITFVYLGQISRSKGVDVAVRSAIGICDREERVRFRIIGLRGEPGEFVRGLLREIEQAGFGERIQIEPYQADPRSALVGARAHICPSIQEESSANVVLDAKAMSVPSIVFPRGGLPELVDHRRNGWVCPEATEDALTAAIEDSIQRSDHWESMGIQAQRSLELHSEQAVAAAWWARFSPDEYAVKPGPKRLS